MLAVRDCREEWPSALCMVFSMAAILIPILILLSVRAGVIGQMREELVSSPKSRELLTVGEPIVSSGLLREIKKRSDVEFVAPRTRFLAAAAVIRSPDGLRSAEVDLVPSGEGDPMLLRGWQKNGLAISESAARSVGAKVDSPIQIIVNRTGPKKSQQSEQLLLTVSEILSHERVQSSQSFIYIEPRLNEAVELWREDPTVQSLEDAKVLAAKNEKTRNYSGLRLYAKTVDDVDTLRKLLSVNGIDVQSRAADIRFVQRLSRSMSVFIGALAFFMIGGLILALGGIQWGWVERKRVDYSYLRLLGMSRNDVRLIPIFQALMLVVPAAAISIAVAAAAQIAINRLFVGQIQGVDVVSRFPLAETILLVAIAFVAAAIAAFLAARNAAGVSPIVALRGS